MEIYLVETCAEILDKFYKLVFLGKFEKVANTEKVENWVFHRLDTSKYFY